MISYLQNATEAFRIQSLFEPDGPKVNSEFYPGWLDWWGKPHQKVKINEDEQKTSSKLSGKNCMRP